MTTDKKAPREFWLEQGSFVKLVRERREDILWGEHKVIHVIEYAELERLNRLLDEVKSYLDLAISIEMDGEGCKSQNVAIALQKINAERGGR